MIYRVLKNSVKKHFHSSEDKYMHWLRIYEKLVKILIEVKRSLSITISEFPDTVKCTTADLYEDVCQVTDLYHHYNCRRRCSYKILLINI